MSHIRYKCKTCSYVGRCVYCEEKIFLCVNCGCVDNELTTDCSGIKLNYWIKQAILLGGLDFFDRKWVIKDKDGTIR